MLRSSRRGARLVIDPTFPVNSRIPRDLLSNSHYSRRGGNRTFASRAAGGAPAALAFWNSNATVVPPFFCPSPHNIRSNTLSMLKEKLEARSNSFSAAERGLPTARVLQNRRGGAMTSDLESDLLVVLYDVARQMRTVVDQIAREHGRTRAQWIILLRLEREPGLSQNELAAIAEVAPITIARLVDRLEECGLVERRPD